MELRGKDWEGLNEMVLGRKSGGGWSKYREGRMEDGGVLCPFDRRGVVDDSKGPDYSDNPHITMDDLPNKQSRDKEVGDIFGREQLPILEKLEFQISVPLIPNRAANDSPPISLKLEGDHVLDGLRLLTEVGYCDEGIQEWMSLVMSSASNKLTVPF